MLYLLRFGLPGCCWPAREPCKVVSFFGLDARSFGKLFESKQDKATRCSGVRVR